MSHETYLLAWQLYAATAALLFVCVWSATKWGLTLISWLVRANLLAILALPFKISSEVSMLAPAWVQWLVSSVLSGMGDPAVVGTALISLCGYVSVGVFSLWFIVKLITRLWPQTKKLERRFASKVKIVSSRWAQFADAPNLSAKHTRGLVHRVRRTRHG